MSKSTRQQVTLFFLSLLAGSSVGDAAEIQFKAQADVRGSLVLLGDVAQIRDSDGLPVEALNRIELFPAPARGRIKTVRDVEIRQLLQLHGIRTADHRFSGSESIRIGPVNIKVPATTPVSATQTAEMERRMVVAKQSIAMGTVIRAVDLELKVPEWNAANASPAIDLNDVIGREVSRNYAAGQVIDMRSLRKPLLVRRGDAVTVVARAAGVRVRTTAKALADGSVGDLLFVESTDRKRDKYSAIVTGSREVEVFASGTSVVDANPPPSKVPRELP